MVAKSSQNKNKFKTYGNVFDKHADRLIFEFHSKHLFDELTQTVALGKEANIFIASAKPKQIIVKIYRLQNANFNKMYDYIKYDPRYDYLKGKKRKTIFAWTQREYRNLLKAREAGARVPKPIAFKDNMILMELIGNNNEPAPELKDAPPQNSKSFLKDIIEQVKKMWKSDLIHGDLSSFNILNNDEKPVLIDFSQSTIRRNPQALELLERDIKNVCVYFKKLGLKTKKEEIIEYILGKKKELKLSFK